MCHLSFAELTLLLPQILSFWAISGFLSSAWPLFSPGLSTPFPLHTVIWGHLKLNFILKTLEFVFVSDICFFFETICLCNSSSCPETCLVDQTGIKLRDLLRAGIKGMCCHYPAQLFILSRVHHSVFYKTEHPLCSPHQVPALHNLLFNILFFSPGLQCFFPIVCKQLPHLL